MSQPNENHDAALIAAFDKVFFAKLASVGVVPIDEEQADLMRNVGVRLLTDEQSNVRSQQHSRLTKMAAATGLVDYAQSQVADSGIADLAYQLVANDPALVEALAG